MIGKERIWLNIFKFNPEIVIPVHYGTFEHYKEPVENIKDTNDEKYI